MGSRLIQFIYQKTGRRAAFASLLAALAGVFAFALTARAQGGFIFDVAIDIIGYSIATILNTLLFAIVWVLGNLISLVLVNVLVIVASYNDFATEWGVNLGWIVVRDIANMFFIIILLVIAVATIFKVESYSYRALLPKLIIMAILINFSRTITGFFIDISQVIMLTFVNSFRNITAGTIIDQIGLYQILKSTASTFGAEASLRLFGAMLLGIAVAAVTCCVLLVIVVVFAFRIVMLWLLTVLSPMAFLLSVFPGGRKYSGQWWEKLAGHLIVGPVLAFFLWLSFTIMQDNLFVRRPESSFEKFLEKEKITDTAAFNPFNSEVGQWDSMINFIIVIGLLMGSLTITSQLGVLGGGIVGATTAGLTKLAWGVPKAAGTFGAMVSRKAAAGELFGSTKAVEGKDGKITYKRTGLAKLTGGIDFNPANLYRRFKERNVRVKEKEELSAKMLTMERMKGHPDENALLGPLARTLAMASSDTGVEILTKGFLWGALGRKKGAGGGLWHAFSRMDPKLHEEYYKAVEDSKSTIAEKKTIADMVNADEGFVAEVKTDYDTYDHERETVEAKLKEIKEEREGKTTTEGLAAHKELKELEKALEELTEALVSSDKGVREAAEKELQDYHGDGTNISLKDLVANTKKTVRTESDRWKTKDYQKDLDDRERMYGEEKTRVDAEFAQAQEDYIAAAAYHQATSERLARDIQSEKDQEERFKNERDKIDGIIKSIEKKKPEGIDALDREIKRLTDSINDSEKLLPKLKGKNLLDAKNEVSSSKAELNRKEKEKNELLKRAEKSKPELEKRRDEANDLYLKTGARRERLEEYQRKSESLRADKTPEQKSEALFTQAKAYFNRRAEKKENEANQVGVNGEGVTEGQFQSYKENHARMQLKYDEMQKELEKKYGKEGSDKRNNLSPEEKKLLEEEEKSLEGMKDKLDTIANLIAKRKANEDDLKKNQEKNEKGESKIYAALKKEAETLRQQGQQNITEARRQVIREEVEKLEKTQQELVKKRDELESYIPQDYYAMRDARNKISEEAHKIETDNEDELISLYRNAMANGDKFLAAGIAQHAAQVGHLNELINEFGMPGQDQTDQNGFNAFINKNFIEKLNMNPQWAYALQNNLSDIAQGLNHWSMAQAVGVENGRYKQRTLAEQRLRVMIETSKRDSEYRIRNSNRLGGWFTERWRDPNDHSKGRQAQLNEFGMFEIKNGLQGLVELVRRNRMNPNVMLNLWTHENQQILRAMKKTLTTKQKELYEDLERMIIEKIGQPREHGGIDPDAEFEPMRKVLRSLPGVKYYAEPLPVTELSSTID